jgi:O-antigen/teichoic acid export membrane protein
MGWFGEAFEAGATCLVWLAAGQAVNALCGPVMYLLNMTGHERPAQRIVWAAALVNLALNLWAIPRFGIAGAAVATALSMALWNVAAAVAVKRLLGLSVWDALKSPKSDAE